MSDNLIVCENCGKKFRLPETFKSSTAKCSQCGSAIDVAGQRAAAGAAAARPAPRADAPKPAAARPAAPKHAAEKPAAADRPARRATASGSVASTSRRGARSAQAESVGARRGRGEAPARKNQMPLLLGAGGVLVLGIVTVLLMSGDEQAKSAPAAPAAVAASTPIDKPAAQVPAATVQPAAAESAPAAAAPKATETASESPAAVANTAPTTPAAEEKKPEPKISADNWMNSKVTSMDEVFDPKKETEAVTWAAYVTEADKTEIMAQLDIVRDGGVKSAGAKTRLERMGHKATFGIISRLREIDYKDSFDAMYGWELNKVLESITGGMNVGYAPVLIGEEMDPRKADWNARTAKAWLELPRKFDTQEAFDEMVRKRRERSK